MDKLECIARETAAEALDWPPHGPCTSELWEEIRDKLEKEFGEPESKWLPLPAGFHDNNPLADEVRKMEEKSKKFDERKPHTFQEWSDHGFRIIKGSKSTGRSDENVATFKRNQVILIEDSIAASWDDPFINEEPF